MSLGSRRVEGRKASGRYPARPATAALGPAERPSFPLATQVLAAETAIEIRFTAGEDIMSDIAYVSKVRIERKVGPLRIAYLRGESQAVTFSVHGAIAKHYKIAPAALN